MSGWQSGLITEPWGIAVIFGNVLVEQLGLPLPAIPILLVAGSMVVPAHVRWGIEVFVAATLACVCTDSGWFIAGRLYGNRLMRLLCRVSLSPDSCVSQTHQRFERWGVKALVVAKFVPGLTVIAVPLAGAQGMHWALFLGLTAVSSALWIAVPLLVGVLAAPQITSLLAFLDKVSGRALAVALALLASYILLKLWQRHRFRAQLRMARVEPSELHTLLQRQPPPPPPVVLDVRSSSARALDPRTIPTAVYVPLDQVQARLASFAHTKEVIVYCSCPNEASAARVAKLLMEHGVKRVRPLRGGLDLWCAAGYPVTSIAPAAAPKADLRAIDAVDSSPLSDGQRSR
jgi:membrane protein DedA with SNARE-associated domain/rhodanese-related sulfurtransferase